MAKKTLYEKSEWEWVRFHVLWPFACSLSIAFIVWLIVSIVGLSLKETFLVGLIAGGIPLPLFLYGFLQIDMKSRELLKEEERILGVRYKDRNDYDKAQEERDWFVCEAMDSFCILHRDFIKEVRSIHHNKVNGSYRYVLTFQDIANNVHTITFKNSPKVVKDFKAWYGSQNKELDDWDPEELQELIGLEEPEKKKARKKG